MTPDDLIKNRKPDWERLSALLQRVQRGQIQGLSEAELQQLGALYRAATSDLAIAQRDFPRHNLALYLNQLVGRAHPVVYRGDPVIWRQLKDFYLRGFPQLFRELGSYMLVSVLLFFGVGLLAYFVMLANPDASRYIMPPGLIARIKNGAQWWKSLNEANEVGAAAIMTNNLRVAFFAFAGGMVLGLMTVYVLVMNGILLGGVIGLAQVYGTHGPLLEFIIGHGVLELSEIVMAGASGLMLGHAMLQPGLLSRRNAVIVAAQKAVRLLLGSAPLLVVAGFIEGIISPSDIIPAAVKYAVGISTGLALYGYLFFGGRGGGQRTGDGDRGRS